MKDKRFASGLMTEAYTFINSIDLTAFVQVGKKISGTAAYSETRVCAHTQCPIVLLIPN